jgi:hypothetical protein
MSYAGIDWSIFDKWPENTCYCRCEAVFRSHSKFHLDRIISRRACPNCGKYDELRRSSSEPETVTVKS